MIASDGPVATSIPDLLARTAKRYGDDLAVRDGDVDLTYNDLQEQAHEFAAALVRRGIGIADRVSIWMPNGAQWIIAALGVFSAGAALVPINTRFKGTEAGVILRRSAARLLVTTTDFLDTDYVAMLDEAGGDLPQLADIVVASGRVPPAARSWEGFIAGGTDGQRAEVERRVGELGPESPSDILFTSGTTGVPKGVVMTHGRTLAVATDWVRMTGLSAGDRYLMVNPYFHMFGLKAGILASVAAGAVMLPEPVFDVDRILGQVAAELITVLPGPPTLYQSILDHPDRDRYDLSTLRVAVTGSADIPVTLIERIRAELPFSLIVSGYGLTEAGTATGTGPDDPPEAIATTVGHPRPGFEVRLGETGEVQLRGPSVMAYYLDDEDATAATLSQDGWLRTGDIGSFDPDGRLQIVGRAKDMFIVGGFNAYPAEIENALLGHPAINAAAVIGIPDERLGEVGMAFVVLSDAAEIDGDAIIAWSRDRIANYKVPRVVEIVEALPLNATGKVVKDELRARAGARQDPVA